MADRPGPAEMAIAVVVPAGFDRARATARIAGVAGDGDVALLSNSGRHLDLATASGEPAHLYADAVRRFRKIFVVKEFSALYANDFTIAWLVLLLADQGEGAELWLEIPDERSNARRNRVTPQLLADRVPGARLRRQKGGWYRMTADSAAAAEAAALPTIYPSFRGGAADFFDIFYRSTGAAGEITAAHRAAAQRTFIYGLYGANQKSFVVERILAAHGIARTVSALDAGGGYGFMAAELAAKGHEVLVSDYDAKKIELVGPWLARRCNLAERLGFAVERLEALGQQAVRYDVISFFGCLLYVDRGELPGILERAIERLNPGGLLLVHENPRESGMPGSLDYERRFPAAELGRLLGDHAGRVTCYSMFTGAPVAWRQAARSVIMAAVQKR